MATEQWVQAYCDGSCITTQRIGGWAAMYLYKGQSKMLSGSEKDTTNNRMELMAVIQALKGLNRRCKIVIYTDSQYVRNGITQWVYKWSKNGWRTANRKGVMNADLWKELLEVSKQHTVEWNWIPGHTGHPYHEEVDRTAYQSAKALLQETKHGLPST